MKKLLLALITITSLFITQAYADEKEANDNPQEEVSEDGSSDNSTSGKSSN